MDNRSLNKEFSKEKNLAFLVTVWKLPQCTAAFISALASGSMIMWMEFVEKISILIPCILLMVMSIKLNRNLKFRFNYGTGKVEAITALSCEMFDLAGLLCVIYFSIRDFSNPAHESNSAIAVILCVAGLALDVFILIGQRKLLHAGHSRMIHTAFLSAQKEFFFDTVAFAALLLEMILKNIQKASYFSPIACLLLAVPFAYVIIHHINGAVMELADLTIDEECQLKILKILNEYYEEYEDYGEIYSRKSGGVSYIDIELNFPDDTGYGKVRSTVSKIKKEIEEEIKDSSVNFIIS